MLKSGPKDEENMVQKMNDGMVWPDKSKDFSVAERLRIVYCAKDDLAPCGVCLTCQAAGEIEKLQKENTALKKALQLLKTENIYLKESTLVLGE